jgi:SAM-dependent methyltransferase
VTDRTISRCTCLLSPDRFFCGLVGNLATIQLKPGVVRPIAMDNRSADHPAGLRLTNYREHYTADADAIVDPAAMPAGRRASELRRLMALLRLLDPQPGERVVDVGCGSGWFSAQCQRTGADVWALDISLVGVSAARERFGELRRCAVGDVYSLPFGPGSLDAVVLSEVVEHLEDIAAALGQTHRLLRRGGRALISVPYREQLTDHLCIHCNRLTPANAHLHSFGPGDLEAQLAASGLAPVRSILLTNKVLDRLELPRLTKSWPFWTWRLLDRAANRVLGRAGFVCVLAEKTD